MHSAGDVQGGDVHFGSPVLLDLLYSTPDWLQVLLTTLSLTGGSLSAEPVAQGMPGIGVPLADALRSVEALPQLCTDYKTHEALRRELLASLRTDD